MSLFVVLTRTSVTTKQQQTYGVIIKALERKVECHALILPSSMQAARRALARWRVPAAWRPLHSQPQCPPSRRNTTGPGENVATLAQ